EGEGIAKPVICSSVRTVDRAQQLSGRRVVNMHAPTYLQGTHLGERRTNDGILVVECQAFSEPPSASRTVERANLLAGYAVQQIRASELLRRPVVVGA